MKAEQKRRPALRCALVVTRKISRTEIGEEAREVLEATGAPIFKSTTVNRIAWAEAPLAGRGVAQYAPKSAAAQELLELVKELERFARGKP